jgi:hypothetical protein
MRAMVCPWSFTWEGCAKQESVKEGAACDTTKTQCVYVPFAEQERNSGDSLAKAGHPEADITAHKPHNTAHLVFQFSDGVVVGAHAADQIVLR